MKPDTHTEKAAFFARFLSRLYLDAPDADLLVELARTSLALEWPFTPNTLSSKGFVEIQTALAGPDLESIRKNLRDEHMLLFIGVGMPLVPLWGSVYLDEENLLMGESTLQLEAFLSKAGLGSNTGVREPLDHLGLVLSALGVLLERLADRVAGKNETKDCLRAFLEAHLSPWVSRCLELLDERAQSSFYRGVGKLTAALLQGLAEAYGAGQVEQKLYY